jgi:hypothetical protein
MYAIAQPRTSILVLRREASIALELANEGLALATGKRFPTWASESVKPRNLIESARQRECIVAQPRDGECAPRRIEPAVGITHVPVRPCQVLQASREHISACENNIVAPQWLAQGYGLLQVLARHVQIAQPERRYRKVEECGCLPVRSVRVAGEGKNFP